MVFPEAPAAREGADLLTKIVTHFCKREPAEKAVCDALRAGRNYLLTREEGEGESRRTGTWKHELDGSLMIFEMAPGADQDKVGQLRITGLAHSDGVAGQCTPFPLPDAKPLPYGRGIAGRAFKANRIRVYDAPQPSDFSDDTALAPDYYEHIKGMLEHKKLVSFPVHIPVDDGTFQNDVAVYQNRAPYGVINIGSSREECPIAELLEREPEKLVAFQHHLNQMLYTEAFAKTASRRQHKSSKKLTTDDFEE